MSINDLNREYGNGFYDPSAEWDAYHLRMTEQELEEAVSTYLIRFDDDGCTAPDPGVHPCYWDAGDPDVGLPPGCEYCYEKEIEQLIRKLDEVDWLTLSAVVDAPEYILSSSDGLNQESLSRLVRVGYLWLVHKAVWATPDGIAALHEYRKPLDTNEIPVKRRWHTCNEDMTD